MNEVMFTGWQVVCCAVTCCAAGIGIGAFGILLIDRLKLPDCASCWEGEKVDCQYRGEPDGCNNRALRAKVLGW